MATEASAVTSVVIIDRHRQIALLTPSSLSFQDLIGMFSRAFNRNSLKRFYHQKVLDHYANPRNVGSLDKTSAQVGTGLVGAPACGDVMKLQIRVDPSSQRITDVRFKTFGCGSAIASSSFATERIKGMTLKEASEIKNTVIAKELSLPPVKLHCSMLAEDAVKAAIRDYLKKNPQATGAVDLDVSKPQ